VEASRVPLASTPTGKPLLREGHFATNLSHSGPWVAIGICSAATIGIDIERSPAHTALQALLPTICTPDELAWLNNLSDSAREHAALALWTRKEALLKAFGVGLTVDPATVSTIIEGPIAPPSGVDQPPCCVRNIDLPPGVIGGLATPVTVGINRFYHLIME
jgi:4'-phosphopantetheinyl transferase